MIRITDLKVDLLADEARIRQKAEKLLGTKCNEIKLIRRTVDARKKNDVHYVLSLDVSIENEEKILNKGIKNVRRTPDMSYHFKKGVKRERRPVVVGTGPAGLFAGLYLARAGVHPLILERGSDVDRRTACVEAYMKGSELSEETNVQFGEGGAGTFSDGKLNTGTKDIRIRTVLEEFVKYGAPGDILIDAKPHIGTDILRTVVKNIRNEIISLGGEVLFDAKLCDFGIHNGRVTSAIYEKEGKKHEFETDKILLCIGHSARDTAKMLYDKGVIMQKKPFSVGARIEHTQDFISSAMYGEAKKLLPPADYKMAVHLPNGRSLYTFCMCPGGHVVAAASEKGTIVTNGMSYSKRDGKNANSAILVGVTPEDFPSDNPLSGFEFQRRIEKRAYELCKNKAPCQTVGSFLGVGENVVGSVVPTYKPGVEMTEIDKVLPPFVTETMRAGLLEMDKKIRGFADKEAILTAPETRSSSPVRFVRNEEMELSIKGLLTAGEGGGYAGGIMSSAVDGLKAAEMIINNE